MVKNILGLTITLSLLYIVSVWEGEAKTEAVVSVTPCSGGYTLSINADTVPLGKILEELAEKCTITVAVYERALLSRAISVGFQEVSIEEGIRKLVTAAGITNHLITYRNNVHNGSEVSAVALFGSSEKTERRALTVETRDRETGKEDRIPVDGDVPPEGAVREKIESFKARYDWADAETRELADYLLTVMPDPAKGSGLDELTKALDNRMKEGDEDTVDEKLLYQAIGDTVPPHIAPFMMESIKNHSRKYRSGEETDSSEGSPNQLYRDFMSTDRSKGGNH